MSKAKKKNNVFLVLVLLIAAVGAGIFIGAKLLNNGDSPIINTESSKKINYAEIYHDTIERYYDIILNSDYDDELNDAESDVMYECRYMDNPIEDMGYVIKDINGDEVPELLIGTVGDKGINAMYTIKNEKVEFVFSGVYRDMYYLMNDNKILNEGSGGAMYSIFGVYNFDGKKLNCEDYYFTYEKEEYSADVGIYHNTTGEMDKKVSEELNMTTTEFLKKREELHDQTVELGYSPFSSFKTNIVKVSKVEFAEDSSAIENFGETQDIVLDDSQYARSIYLITDGSVKDFTFYSLEYKSTDSKGNAKFDKTEKFKVENFEHKAPLNITLTVNKDTPEYGYTFVNEKGEIKSYVIEYSGFDGSLYVTAKEF